MKPWAAFRLIAADLGALFPRGERAKYAFFLLGSLVLQAAFWYLATPGPTLLRMAPQEPLAAFSSVAWSAILLLLIPAVFYRFLIGPLEGAGFRIGDWRFGLAAAVPLALLAAVLMYFASTDPTLAATYPWAGTWVGSSAAHLAQWSVIYGLYYLAFEGFYRGFVLSVATRATSPTVALWLSVVMATLVHLGKPLAEVMAAAPASILFAVIAVRSRSILYSLLLHLAIGLALDLAVLARSGHLLN
ncbi:MAG TPA: CPBP family intramembrane glutamic endopeptidase [Trueperaceae bacterium]|nr:CPBP family intramembrane glutamic endopeptidase [Trueperaceae bacterium]